MFLLANTPPFAKKSRIRRKSIKFSGLKNLRILSVRCNKEALMLFQLITVHNCSLVEIRWLFRNILLFLNLKMLNMFKTSKIQILEKKLLKSANSRNKSGKIVSYEVTLANFFQHLNDKCKPTESHHFWYPFELV